MVEPTHLQKKYANVKLDRIISPLFFCGGWKKQHHLATSLTTKLDLEKLHPLPGSLLKITGRGPAVVVISAVSKAGVKKHENSSGFRHAMALDVRSFVCGFSKFCFWTWFMVR